MKPISEKNMTFKVHLALYMQDGDGGVSPPGVLSKENNATQSSKEELTSNPLSSRFIKTVAIT